VGSSLTSKITVSTAADANSANDSATVTSSVVAPDPIEAPVGGGPTTPPDVGPGPSIANGKELKARLVDGAIKLGSLDAVPLKDGQLSLNGQIGDGGAVAVPKDGIAFAPLELPINAAGLSLVAKIILTATGAATGTIPAGGGTAHLKVPVQVKLEATLSTGAPLLGSTSSCYIGPIDFDLSGPYDVASKKVSLSSTTVGLPQAGSGCGALGTTVNGLLSLPSTTNSVTLNFLLDADTTVKSPPVDTPQAAGVAAFGKLSSKLTKNVLTAPITCGPAKAKNCAGILGMTTVAVTKTKKGKKTVTKKKTVTLAMAPYTVVAGKPVSKQLTLSASGQKLLKAAGKKGMKVALTLTPTGAKKPTVTKSLTLKYAKAKAAKKAKKKK
jgi:hypothetical protein